MNLEEAEALGWGTFGKGVFAEHVAYGTPLPKCIPKRLGDLDTDHLEAIQETQKQLPLEYLEAIALILESRNAGDKERGKIRRRDAIAATKAQVSRDAADKNGEGRD